MKLIDALQSEHALIEAVVGSFRTWVTRRVEGAVGPEEGGSYLRFFRLYAGRFHHAREEDILFTALVRETEVPADRGPLRALRDDHASMAAILEDIAPLVEAPLDRSSDAGRRLAGLVERHGRALLHHIDAESSVLFPESERRFRRSGPPELLDREADEDEAAARADGERLVTQFPPSEYPDAMRGDGCVACLAYGVTCDGVEREWWSDTEWEDFFHRND